MRLTQFSDLVSLFSVGHIFSEHSGLNPKEITLRKVGPIQYAVHWLYGVSEPTILRLTDWALSRKWLTNTKSGKLVLRAITAVSWYFPYGIVVTTKAAVNWVDYITNAEGPKGARLAVGPCVCQKALNRWKEPVMKDITVLYGADIYYHLNMGYELIAAERAKSILEACHQEGLVHVIEFCFQSGKWNFVICNCDSEICAPTRVFLHTGKFQYPGPEIASHDPVKCIGKDNCGKCLQRCIYSANQVSGDVITYHAENCMGCGLCVTTCKGEARSMSIRKDYHHDKRISSKILLG
ncbi:MAG: ferredoxin family protein [Proteobacteria bacterium]|nr:ferredoxin family protein [Pseudomonadota bacterium]MBU1697962.1 ferredoxin family protein [Pseudomonadota bacterium]